MAVPPPSKKELRSILRDRRQKFVFNTHIDSKRRLAINLSDRVLAWCSDARIVAAYLPIDAEIDTHPLIDALAMAGKIIALPHVVSRIDTPQFLRWHPGDPLEDGPFGLKQPALDAEPMIPDLILTPLLGFDRALHRIGYGAGHYDRAFATYPHAARIGLAWAIQECDAVPVDPWDVPLHAIATEREWITN
jgi:5-formyltetrahydrofolate cyclo-ligase